MSIFIWIALLLTPAVSFAELGSFKDRLVAVVDQNTITENDIRARYEIHQHTHPAFQRATYEQARATILEELCLDQIHLLMASSKSGIELPVEQERVEYFRANYPGIACSDHFIKKAIAAATLREQLAKQLASTKVKISQNDLMAATHQPMIWSAIKATWSFDLAYSDQPISSELAEYKASHFNNYPAASIAPDLLKHIDWTKQNSWQFFESDGEYVAFRIDNIQAGHLLPNSYEVNFIPKSAHTQRTAIPLKISSALEAAPEILSIVDSLAINEVSKQLISIQGEDYAIELIAKTPTGIDKIEGQLILALREQRMHQLIPEWYAELKNNHFIKVYHP